MKWTTSRDVRAQLQKIWDKGTALRSIITNELAFPMRLKLSAPTSSEISTQFETLRNWSANLRSTPHIRIEMREFKHRVFGSNQLPAEIWLDSFDDMITILAKRKELAIFKTLASTTQQAQPLLISWLVKRPLRALELAEHWSQFLDIVAWMQAHPRPDIYLRQVDIAGVHSKFIESHRAVLMELFDLALPAQQIDVSATNVSQFSRRYGFRDKPVRVRFRPMLPESVFASVFGNEADISLDAESFSRLDLKVARVFIIENEINFLAFPSLHGSMVIFGSGYGFDMLKKAGWLNHCRIFYWGDIDTHGFAILDQLRHYFPHAVSLLMDKATLLEHQILWTKEHTPTQRELQKLNTEEKNIYDDLRDNRIAKNIRLEQESIHFEWLINYLKQY